MLATVERQNREARGSQWSEQDEAEFKAVITAKYAKESSAYYSSARMWDDAIIMPHDTRRVLGLSLDVCYDGERSGGAAHRHEPATTSGSFSGLRASSPFGVFRM